MRKVTKNIVRSFLNKEAAKISNSQSTGTHLRLHNNVIAYHVPEGIMINCNYNSMTTRERLNGIPGVQVYVRKGQLFLNGHAWNGDYVLIRNEV